MRRIALAFALLVSFATAPSAFAGEVEDARADQAAEVLAQVLRIRE
jgi:hypothetical protein